MTDLLDETDRILSSVTEHTPTPYRHENSWIMAGPIHVATIPRAHDGDWSPSNAEFIVRACNAHDDLVVALEKAIPVLFLHVGPNPQATNPIGRLINECKSALEKARDQ